MGSNNHIDGLPSASAVLQNTISDEYDHESAPILEENITTNENTLLTNDNSIVKLEPQVFTKPKSIIENNIGRNIMKIKLSPGNNSETKILNSIMSLPISNSSSMPPAKRKSTRRFGMRRPKSRKQREEMSKLREVSMRLGGAQYFKKKSTESVACEVYYHLKKKFLIKFFRNVVNLTLHD